MRAAAGGNLRGVAADEDDVFGRHAEKVGAYGSPIDIPLKHKLDSKTRSHHQTITFRVEDAPLPREILIACAASNSGRPLARLATFGAEVKK